MRGATLLAAVIAVLAGLLLAIPGSGAATLGYQRLRFPKRPHAFKCQNKVSPKTFGHFGTYTPYEAADVDLTVANAVPEGCRPLHFWMLARHGTRYGPACDITTGSTMLHEVQSKIQEAWKLKRSTLCQAEVEALRKWDMEPEPCEAEELAGAGRQDHLRLGKRVAARLQLQRSNFIDKLQRPGVDFEFSYGETQRTKASGEAFFEGLLNHVPNTSGTLEPFPFSQFYTKCKAYSDLRRKPEFRREMQQFYNGPEMNATLVRVSSRLGLEGNLTTGEMMQMVIQCELEVAWSWYDERHSPWCAAFDARDFEVFEYHSDLREMYRTGYGFDLLPRLGCVGVKNIFDAFRSRMMVSYVPDASPSPSATMYFSHDTYLNMLIAHLGLYKDAENVRADNFLEMRNRKYRASQFSPFSANLQATLYECDKGEKFQVAIALNEKPVSLPACEAVEGSNSRSGVSGPILYPWSEFEEAFEDSAMECDIRQLCNIAGAENEA